MYRKIVLGMLGLAVLFAVSGCGRDRTLLQTDQPVVIKTKGKISYDYRIKPNDRVAITVYKYPELTPTSMSEKGILVDSQGYVSLPLIHRVHLAGLTQTQAAKMLERRYGKYLKDPSLNLEVMNKRAYILGEVKKPGPVPLDREKTTVFEAIAMGEGLTDDAVRDNILVLSHDSRGNLELRRIDLSNYHNIALSNITIKPDDVIYVPPSSWKEFRINSQNFTSVFKTISDIAQPFVTLHYLFDD
ncbi:polysaccharide biosynthesis/export family protein [Nitratifractor salsuginis]|uniref:Polysaccharide export protein n=1 Tax=Nitratifractor salsuginis (strain DSM 16511 / JCM 12458 / E9I37-1) TaxID=749222 RepID=E6X1B8_NITSE|nr:polysaccharide biosynthesis/export family protein [Nitratifractor salsuginis]ADV46980.1 polysaccharide export protein [Nitratifractor salsuginis DSM 16511]